MRLWLKNTANKIAGLAGRIRGQVLDNDVPTTTVLPQSCNCQNCYFFWIAAYQKTGPGCEAKLLKGRTANCAGSFLYFDIEVASETVTVAIELTVSSWTKVFNGTLMDVYVKVTAGTSDECKATQYCPAFPNEFGADWSEWDSNTAATAQNADCFEVAPVSQDGISTIPGDDEQCSLSGVYDKVIFDNYPLVSQSVDGTFTVDVHYENPLGPSISAVAPLLTVDRDPVDVQSGPSSFTTIITYSGPTDLGGGLWRFTNVKIKRPGNWRLIGLTFNSIHRSYGPVVQMVPGNPAGLQFVTGNLADRLSKCEVRSGRTLGDLSSGKYYDVGLNTHARNFAIVDFPKVSIIDQYRNEVPSAVNDVTITFEASAPGNPKTGTMSGTPTRAAVLGIATFPGLRCEGLGYNHRITASSAGLVNIPKYPGDPVRYDRRTQRLQAILVYEGVPSTIKVGVPFEVTIKLCDINLETIIDAAFYELITIYSDLGNYTADGQSQIPIAGVVKFTGSFTVVGSYVLQPFSDGSTYEAVNHDSPRIEVTP